MARGYRLPSYLAPEVKFHDQYMLSGTPLPAGLNWASDMQWQDGISPSLNIVTPSSATLLANVCQGTSENTRIGRKIKVMQMILDMSFYYTFPGANYIDNRDLDMFIVYDTQNNNHAAGTSANDVWNTGTGYIARPRVLLRNLDEQSRFKILRHVKIKCPTVSTPIYAGANHPHGLKFSKRVIINPNKLIHYDVKNDTDLVSGASYDGTRMPGGNISVWFCAPDSTVSDTIWELTHFHVRTKFIDV